MSDKEMLMNADELKRIVTRCKELSTAIKTINDYPVYLRTKYYLVLLHSIKLLHQYTLILKDNKIK